MIADADGKVDWFRIVLEFLRYGIFVGFYFLSIRVVYVTLTNTPPIVAMVIGAAALIIAVITWWKIEWALYWFVILIPAVSGFQMIGFMKTVPLLSVGFAIIFLVWLPKRWFYKRETIVPRSVTGNFVDVLSGVVLLSLVILFVQYPLDFVIYRLGQYPFAGQLSRFYGLVGGYVILQGLFFYRVMALEIPAERFSKWMMFIINVQSLIIMGFSLFQWAYRVPPMHWGSYGIKSPFDDIHSYGSYVVLLFFVFLTLGTRRGNQRYVNVIFALLLFVLLIWSGGNGTFAAMLVIGIIFLAKVIKRKYFIMIVSLLALGGVTIFMIPSIITKSEYPVIRRYERLLDVRKLNEKLSSRFLLWDRAAVIMEEFPLTGGGVGTFYRISPSYHDKAVNKWKEWSNWHENTHNYYLQFGAELGVPALLIFLSIIICTFRRGFESLREKEESGVLIGGFVFGLSAYLITMLTSHPLLLSNQQFLFWFVLGVLNIGARETVGLQTSVESARIENEKQYCRADA